LKSYNNRVKQGYTAEANPVRELTHLLQLLEIATQIREAEKQGRELDYKQATNKIINTLLKPSTQQDFAKALVDFLSRHRSKATRGVGAEIYQWLHKDNNWKQARDLALLAIASYTGKSKEGDAELPAELLDELENEQSNDSFELSPM
jgi:hypothetical protein